MMTCICIKDTQCSTYTKTAMPARPDRKLGFQGKETACTKGFDKMFSKFTVYRRKYFSEDTFLDDLYIIFNLSGILINVFKKTVTNSREKMIGEHIFQRRP